MSKISNFNQLLIIPFAKNLQDSISLSKEYGTGFEFNEFAYPWILENKKECKELIKKYTSQKDMPAFKTSHGAFFDTYIFSDDKRIKKVSEYRMRQSLNIAKKLKCKAVIFHGNINPLLLDTAAGPVYEKHWLESSRSFFRTICDEFPEINVYIENMWDRNPDNLANLAAEMTDIKNFGLCFDYAHANISPTDTEIWCKKLKPYIRHIHVNDNDGKRDLHLAIGEGTTDWNKFFSLRDSCFPDSSMLIETSSFEAQKKSLEFISKF